MSPHSPELTPLETAEHLMPGACLGAMTLPEDIRMVMARGEGSKVYDATGKEYIDYVLGSGPLILGHNHPAVVGAVQKQLMKGSTFYALNEPAIHLAEVLTEAAPCGEAVRFQTTGSEAVTAAVRLARGYTGKEKILAFEGAFHGGSDIAQAQDSDGIPHGVKNDILIAPFNDVETAVSLIDGQRRKLAAVLVEPFQRVLKPEPGFLEKVREATREHAIPLIFDEVVTGFRIAWGGAQERYSITPDLACYGKILGGGFPLSAVVGRKEILALADQKRKGSPSSTQVTTGHSTYCFLGGTFTGNPIACAAGLETLDILSTPGVYKRLRTLGNRLRKGIQKVGTKLGIPLQVLGDGPLLQTFFVDPLTPLRNHKDLLNTDRKRALDFSHELIRRGIYCTPGGKMYLSLAHTDADIERTLEIVREALEIVDSRSSGPSP